MNVYYFEKTNENGETEYLNYDWTDIGEYVEGAYSWGGFNAITKRSSFFDKHDAEDVPVDLIADAKRVEVTEDDIYYLFSLSPTDGIMFYEGSENNGVCMNWYAPAFCHKKSLPSDNKWFERYGIQAIPCSAIKAMMEEVGSTKNDDHINPSHYDTNGGIQPIDIIRSIGTDEYQAFCQGNVIKYVMRYKKKNGLEDLLKARTYLDWLIEEYKKE